MNELDIPIEEFTLAMEEHNCHNTLVDTTEMIYKYGLHRVLRSLADYCSDPKECYALLMLANVYKENERAICENAPTMQ